MPSPQTDLLEAEPQLAEFMRVALVPSMRALGFTSVRQFNDTVREVFALTPSALRARRTDRPNHPEERSTP